MRYTPFRSNLETGKNRVLNLLRDTSIEIYLAAALGLAVGTGCSIIHENERTKTIPLAFSEITQIESDASEEDHRLAHLNRYLPEVNDAAMKIFEAHNIAQKGKKGSFEERFANALRIKMDARLDNHHYGLRDLLEIIPKEGMSTLKEFQDLSRVRADLPSLNSLLDNSWEDYHHDVTHTETTLETKTETDSDGNTHISMVPSSHTVYDYTDHTFTYHPEAGAKSSQELTQLVNSNPNLSLPNGIRLTRKTNAKGEEAAQNTRKADRKKPLSKFELKELANTWWTGSTIKAAIPTINSSWGNLQSLAPRWQVAYTQAHSTAYRTYSHYDAGPPEFQIAEDALRNGQTLFKALDKVQGSINDTIPTARTLLKDIEEYVALESGLKSRKNNAEYRKAILQTAYEIYNKNFEEAPSLTRFRWYMPFLWGVAGLAGCGFLGAVVDRLGDEKRWFAPKPEKPPVRQPQDFPQKPNCDRWGPFDK